MTISNKAQWTFVWGEDGKTYEHNPTDFSLDVNNIVLSWSYVKVYCPNNLWLPVNLNLTSSYMFWTNMVPGKAI